MKRSLLLALALAPVGAHAGLESVLNPMQLANPTVSPLSMVLPLGGALLAPSLLGSPFGGGLGIPFSSGYGSPLSGYGNPLGGFGSPMGYGNPPMGFGNPLGGYGNPLTGYGSPLVGLGGASLLRPAIQAAPGLLSLQHQAPQMLTNPYMGGPFSQLPFTQSNRQPGFGSNPFGAAGYGAQNPAYGFAPNVVQSQPNFGGAFPGWPGVTKPAPVPPAPVQPTNPYLPQSGSPAPVQAQMTSTANASQPMAFSPTLTAAQSESAQALAGTLVDLLKSLATPPPSAPSGPVPTSVPFTSPWGADVAPAQGRASPPATVPAAALPSPWGSTPPPQVMAVQAAPTPAAPVQNQGQGDEGALTPFDPAYWLLPPELPEPAK